MYKEFIQQILTSCNRLDMDKLISIHIFFKEILSNLNIFFLEIDPPRTTPEQQSRTAMNTPSAILPPVISGTDNRVLHRAEAHTNICVICQLPRWSHGHQSPGEAVCCCHDQEGTRSQMRRFTTTGHENHTALHAAPPIQIGQRRHSLMMARLNENQYEHKPRPPERGHAGTNR